MTKVINHSDTTCFICSLTFVYGIWELCLFVISVSREDAEKLAKYPHSEIYQQVYIRTDEAR